MKNLSSNVMRGSFWPSINFLGGPQLFPKWPHFADFRVWEIQLRRLGRRKGDFSGERPNIARTSNLWPGLIMPKGQVCRTHATPETIPSPRSTFLRVLANYAKIPIYMPCFFFWKKSKLFCVAFLEFYIGPHDSGLLKSHLPPPKHVWGGLQGWSKGHILADFQGIFSTLKKN